MASTLAFEDQMLKLILNATSVPAIADNAVVTPQTEFFVGLHTDDPAKAPAPTQTSGEITYTAYARMPVPRTVEGWTVGQGKAFPTEIIEFPVVAGVTGTPRVAAFFSVGGMLTGAGTLYFSGKLNPPINIANGVEPRIDNASTASRFEEEWA